MSSSGSTSNLPSPPSYIPFDYPLSQTIDYTEVPFLKEVPHTANRGIRGILDWGSSRGIRGKLDIASSDLLDSHYLGQEVVNGWTVKEKRQFRQYALAALKHTLERLPGLTVEAALATNAFGGGVPRSGNWKTEALTDHAVYVDWLVQQRQGGTTMPTFLKEYNGGVGPGFESVRDIATNRARIFGVKDLATALLSSDELGSVKVEEEMLSLWEELYPWSGGEWAAAEVNKWERATLGRMLAVQECLPGLTFGKLVGSRSFGHSYEDGVEDRHWLRVVAEVDEVRRRRRAEERSLTADSTHA